MDPILRRIKAGEPPSPLPRTSQEALAQRAYEELVHPQRETNLPAAAHEAMNLFSRIANFERRFTYQGIEDAVERTIREAFKLPGDDFITFDLRIMAYGEAAALAPHENRQLPPITDQLLQEEVNKRRCIDHLLFGGAHYGALDLASDALEKISSHGIEKIDLYRDFFKKAEIVSFLTDERTMMLGRLPVAGVSSVNTSEYPYEVQGAGANTIVLLHEGIKGLFEVVAMRGLPGALDPIPTERQVKLRQQVLDHADKTQYELWDLRLGIKLWSAMFGSTVNDRTLEDFRTLVERPARDFFQQIPPVSLLTF